MEHPWDNAPGSEHQPPHSYLNPLLNPTLDRNFGRWAEVYLSNPPEKRDDAVLALLRQLEDETPEAKKARGPQLHSSPTAEPQHAVWCPACRQKNPATLEFCALCGYPLSAAPPIPGTPDLLMSEGKAWLGSKTLAAKAAERAVPAQLPIWKLLSIVLALVLFGFVYLQQRAGPVRQGQATARTAASITAQEQPRVEQPPQPVPEPPRAGSEATAVHSFVETEQDGHQDQLAGSSVSPALTRPPSQPAAAIAEPQAGNEAVELILARHYLNAQGTARNSAEAAQWLWKAVGKQNSAAALLLADLYMHGDGVRKNCDQARLLLVAAAKKGVPEVGVKLRNLESSGCQ